MKLKFDLEKFLKEIGDINYHVVCIAIVFLTIPIGCERTLFLKKVQGEERNIYHISNNISCM